MDQPRRQLIVEGLDANDVETNMRAAEQMHKESSLEDIPWLTQLLKHQDFFVRESAAWPLAELAGPTVLTEIFTAYQRGFDEGHDNDGFTAALMELAALHPAATTTALRDMIRSEDNAFLVHAEWLLQFCPFHSD